MSLLSIILTLAVIGLILWAVNAYIPMPPTVKKVINIVAAIVIAIWLLRIFGIWGHVDDIKI